MLPPSPPSPPEGPPRGTYFSRRNATQPLPPSPAFTEIFASSTNISVALSANQNSKSKPDARSSVSDVRKAGKVSRCGTPKNKNGPDRSRGRSGFRWLVCSLGLFRGLDADEAPMIAAVGELHVAGNKGEQSVVLALRHVFAGLVPGAPLPHQNRAGVDQLPPEALNSKSLSV